MIPIFLLALSLVLPMVSTSGSTSASPRIQFLGAEDIPNTIGCVGFPPGTSDMQTLFAWGQFVLVVKVDGRVERLDLEKTSESHAQKGSWRRGDRIRQEFSSGRISAVIDLTLTIDCREEEGCKTGITYDGDLTIQLAGTTQEKVEKTIRIQVYCGC